MDIRPYRESDHCEIVDLFHGAVHAIDTAIYSEEQVEAWAPTPPDYRWWRDRLSVKKPLVALKDGLIVGFIELEPNGYIDCLYVHKDHQGEGIASLLLKQVIKLANDQGIKSLYVDASKLARPLFTKFGFELSKANTLKLKDQVLTNFSMSLASVESSL